MGRASKIHGYLQDKDYKFQRELNFICGEIDNFVPGFCRTCQLIGRLLDK